MTGKLIPRHFGDVENDGGAFLRLTHGDSSEVGMKGAPNTGSLCGIGGSAQVPMVGGLIFASTCTSMSTGLPVRMACSSAPAKSSERVTVMPSTPQARANAAKSGLYGFCSTPW